MARALGIDFGMTSSVIAAVENGTPTVMERRCTGWRGVEWVERTTPSLVGFAEDGEILIARGIPEEHRWSESILSFEKRPVVSEGRIIRSVKRHLGSGWTIDIDGKKYSPQQISAVIIRKLMKDAEAHLGERITDAVITVPAHFNEAQRQATKEAGQLAGANVLRIMDEPTAAVLAYHLEREDEATILVFDLGGGGLDVSLLRVSRGVVNVIATGGDNHLGSDGWNQPIVDWLVKDFMNSHGIDLSKDKMAVQKLSGAAEKAKIELSQSTESQIRLPYIPQGPDGSLHLDVTLTRAEFQRITSHVLDRCEAVAQQVMQRVGVSGINHVVLVSNATRMPAVIELAKKLSGGKEPYADIAPDEVIAIGASIQADILKGEEREIKVVLVGEGSVGKTSLVTALSGGRFSEHARTHGIEISSLKAKNPDSGDTMTLRFWDFGGQVINRTTHQFFFSPDALYLVVWNARAGHHSDDVAGWLSRIYQRIGNTAKVLLVATHSDHDEPDFDYEALSKKFPSLVCGYYAVDNKTGRGISALRTTVIRHAVDLPSDDKFPETWAQVIKIILSRAVTESQLSYEDFVKICVWRGITGVDARTLATRLHRRGQIIYHGDDERLRDLLILNPEWLAKAIDAVLWDSQTRAAGGILDHARLREIWSDYDRKHYPYFLRLMEKFDVSFRLEDGHHSLIAQLAPTQKPEIPWDRHSPIAEGMSRLAVICRLPEPVNGLVAALTVRLSYADTGLRWRTGVFLRHPNTAYASEALIEVSSEFELVIEVRAPSPDFFLHVLRESVEHLVDSWLGLSYRLFIPCLAHNTTGCDGRFPLDSLLKARRQQTAALTCPECVNAYQVTELLTGFSQPVSTEASAAVARIEQSVYAGQAHAASAALDIRRLMALAGADIRDCPRLFTLVSVPSIGLQKLRPHYHRFRLTLWCEHPGSWHPLEEGGDYVFERPAKWFQQVSRYARPVLSLLRAVIPPTGPLVGLTLTKDEAEHAKNELDLMQALLAELPSTQEADKEWITAHNDSQPARAEGAYLRGVRQLLRQIDHYQQYGDLRRVQDPSGADQWVCRKHLAEYERSMPVIK